MRTMHKILSFFVRECRVHLSAGSNTRPRCPRPTPQAGPPPGRGAGGDPPPRAGGPPLISRVYVTRIAGRTLG
jgi:hypothetical protein